MTPVFITIFAVSAFSVHALDEDIATSLRKSLTKLSFAGDPLAEIHRPGLNCSDQTRAVKCANMSSEVDSDYSDAKVSLNRMRSQVASYLQKKEILQHKLLRDEVRAVSDVLRCMHDKYDHLSLECTTNHGGKIGRIVGTTPFEVNAYVEKHNDLMPNLITLGSGYFLYPKVKRVGILIHELSHFCGTRDIEYYLPSYRTEKIPATPFTQIKREGNFLSGYKYTGTAGSSAVNGDNFSLWSVNGFCVPEFDCK